MRPTLSALHPAVHLPAAAAVLVVLIAAPAAQAEPDDGAPERGPLFRHTYSIKWTYPQGLASGITAILCTNRDRWSSGPSVSGVVMQAEPGIGGLKLGVGWGFVSSVRTFTGDSLGFLGHMGIPWFGYAVKVVALRTAYEPWGVAAGQTYLGLDLQADLVMLNLNIGLLRHVDGDRPGREWALTWGLGYGF
jgi:hypothetical protein